MNKTTKIAALVLAKLMLTSLVFAQSGKTGHPNPTSVPPGTSMQQQSPDATPAPSENAQPHSAPVLWISSVEVLRSAHGPQLDVIRVRGLVATEGWESAELVPLTKGVPADGVLDLAMIADAPEDNSSPTAYPEVEAVFTVEPGHPFKGVRVHSASNRVVLHALPGYAESSTPPKDCTACQGKTFVAKGKTAPASATAGIVREEELPRNLRVIRADEGIASLDSNPNRMTILLDENDQIVMALWD